MRMNTREKACRGKKAFLSRKDARRFLKSRRYQRQPLSEYQCPYCPYWHTTSCYKVKGPTGAV